MPTRNIVIKGARQHNLKNLDITIPRNKFVVITGVSGSGKSSLAFDTIYAEGQRKYVESLSSYARQFLEQMQKPDVDSIDGLSPAISIEQKTTSKNPRSTVGTVTEIYDYLRVLFARVGKPFCYKCGKPIQNQTITQITNSILNLENKSKISILSPLVRGRKGEYKKLLNDLRREGYVRIKIDGEVRKLSDEIVLDKKISHDIDLFVDRLVMKDGIKTRLVDSLELALGLSDGLIKIEVFDNNGSSKEHIFSQNYSCIDCGVSYAEIEPRNFSFNNPHGACPKCSGLGFNQVFDPKLIVSDPTKSIIDGALAVWPEVIPDAIFQVLQSVSKHFSFKLSTPFEKLSDDNQNILLYGSEKKIALSYVSEGKRYSTKSVFSGIIAQQEKRYSETGSEAVRRELEKLMSHSVCSRCNGQRLKTESLHVKIDDKNISDVCEYPINECIEFFNSLNLSIVDSDVAHKLIQEIKSRLTFLTNVGLNYLSLSRASSTLSGGEGQRIRLATQIGSSLVGVLYILDEPSIGLHQRDNDKLLTTLKSLKNLGNSVIVVEHDRETIESSDYIFDMGPKAGKKGGFIIAEGTVEEIRNNEKSLTGKYLSNQLSITAPNTRRTPDEYIKLSGACLHNLKDVDLKIPIGLLTCVTGVSGSGKSSLIVQTLYPALKEIVYNRGTISKSSHYFKNLTGGNSFDKIIDINQNPIGRTPRSNPATYSGLFASLRDLFASLPESKARGYKPGRFSFNVKGGRCESCNGDGLIRVEMHFLPDHFVTCDACGGKRYNRETLEIRFKGKTISEILNMTVNEAFIFFDRIPNIKVKLKTLSEVGLGYITLGQSATTLSGGEAQRLKLAKELSKESTGKTFYILDEPTSGLHFDDINQLLTVLHSLVEKGNTMIVIEHNLDVVKTADHIIDMGPEGGHGGGYIVVEGPPEIVAASKKSHTGKYLKRELDL